MAKAKKQPLAENAKGAEKAKEEQAPAAVKTQGAKVEPAKPASADAGAAVAAAAGKGAKGATKRKGSAAASVEAAAPVAAAPVEEPKGQKTAPAKKGGKAPAKAAEAQAGGTPAESATKVEVKLATKTEKLEARPEAKPAAAAKPATAATPTAAKPESRPAAGTRPAAPAARPAAAAPPRTAAPTAPAGPLVPLIDTNLAAAAAASMLVHRDLLSNPLGYAGGTPADPAQDATGSDSRQPPRQAPPPARQESATFKQLKQGLNKPAGGAGGVGNLLGMPPGQKKSNLPFSGQRQSFRNQTFGADVNRTGVPRRTGG